MPVPKLFIQISLVVSFTLFGAQGLLAQSKERTVHTPMAKPVIWSSPGNIGDRNLLYGPGSSDAAPVAPFTFLEEDKDGESPKFEVRDSAGVVWTVKLGPEAQAETVATRLVWSVGYFAEEAYYFDEVQVDNLAHLSRGTEYVTGNVVRGARFEPKRTNMRRGETWGWQKNPFRNTRELNGLKVLMILLNNFDAHSGNNRIISVDSPQGLETRYYVTDLGATLGRAGGFGGTRTKNNLADFLSTKFVRGVDVRDGVVEFDYDTRPSGLGHLSVLHPVYYRHEVNKEKAMRGIPVAHARWIGSLLAQLSDEQLRDAFRAANYSDGTRESYVTALRQRINQLTALRVTRGVRKEKSDGITTKIRSSGSKAVDEVGTGASKVFKKAASTIKKIN